MKTPAFVNTITRSFHKVGFEVKKHSPEILVVAGVVGVVASTVMACKATTKVSEILADTKANVDAVHDVLENPIEGQEYTQEDATKDLTIIYVQTGLKLVKLYAPAVILGTLSLTSIVTSHNILRQRNMALAAAYSAVDKGFKEYRGRVVERFGKELDKELRYNIKAKEIEETVVDDKGKEKTVTRVVNTVETTNEPSVYARFFDDTCDGWQGVPEYNFMFLRRQQDYANEKLRTRGHVFLNEIYDMLGMQRSKAGAVVGWIYDENNPNGDNYIDFGIYDLYDEQKRLFVNGHEPSILLDFNVDGTIYNKI